MQEDPLITIVIPIYNVQKYLTRCLSSVRNQSYHNLEIILVDDGSTDDSAQICMEFCHQDPRFRLIRQKNAGLGAARNAGMDLANGSYICFIDSDDFIHPDYIRLLYKNLSQHHADISICCYQIVQENLEDSFFKENKKINNKIKVMDREGLLKELVTSKTSEVTVAWNKLLSKECLEGFRFVNKWHEDEFMINDYILRCSRAVLTSAELYFYRYRPDSIMGTTNNADPRHLYKLEAREIRIRDFYVPEYKNVWKDLFLNYLKNILGLYTNLAKDKETSKKIKEVLYPRYLRKFFRYLLLGGFFRRNNFGLHLVIFLISPSFYKWLSDSKNNSQFG